MQGDECLNDLIKKKKCIKSSMRMERWSETLRRENDLRSNLNEEIFSHHFTLRILSCVSLWVKPSLSLLMLLNFHILSITKNHFWIQTLGSILENSSNLRLHFCKEILIQCLSSRSMKLEFMYFEIQRLIMSTWLFQFWMKEEHVLLIWRLLHKLIEHCTVQTWCQENQQTESTWQCSFKLSSTPFS